MVSPDFIIRAERGVVIRPYERSVWTKLKYDSDVPENRSERDLKVGFLKDEYLLLQKLYEDFDSRIITIKGWSATIGLVAVGGGFYYTKYLWLFGAGIGFIFWVLEAIWKSFQYSYASRIQLLEEAFRSGDIEKIRPFQIYTAWVESFQSTSYVTAVSGNMALPLVFIPHIIPVLAGPILFLLDRAYHFSLH